MLDTLNVVGNKREIQTTRPRYDVIEDLPQKNTQKTGDYHLLHQEGGAVIFRALKETYSLVPGEVTVATGSIATGHIEFQSDTPDWLLNMYKRVDQLERLQDNWNGDGAEAPNAKAVYWTRKVLGELFQANIQPARMLPTAEGGIMITFRSGKKYADIECDNSGDILAITSDGESEPDVWVVNPETISLSLEKIHDFITEWTPRTYAHAGASY